MFNSSFVELFIFKTSFVESYWVTLMHVLAVLFTISMILDVYNSELIFASLPFKYVLPDIVKSSLSIKASAYVLLIMYLFVLPFAISSKLRLSILSVKSLFTVSFNSFNLLIKVFEVDVV